MDSSLGHATEHSLLTLQATAADPVGVKQVQFVVNGTLLSTDLTTPYSTTWRVPGAKGKTYQLQAKASDAAGNLGQSPLVTVSAQ